MRAALSEWTKTIAEVVRMGKWGRAIDIILDRVRGNGDRECLIVEEEGEKKVVVSQKEVANGLKVYFDNWMGNQKKYWHDNNEIFANTKEGRRLRIGIVEGTLSKQREEELMKGAPKECKGVLKWHRKKKIGKGDKREHIGEQQYFGAGVMQEITGDVWDEYWKEKSSNKASDYHGKHSNLIKALRKTTTEEEEGERIIKRTKKRGKRRRRRKGYRR